MSGFEALFILIGIVIVVDYIVQFGVPSVRIWALRIPAVKPRPRIPAGPPTVKPEPGISTLARTLRGEISGSGDHVVGTCEGMRFEARLGTVGGGTRDHRRPRRPG